MGTSESERLRLLNEKYLKLFIRKFWLQPIPEVGDEKDNSFTELDRPFADRRGTDRVFGTDLNQNSLSFEPASVQCSTQYTQSNLPCEIRENSPKSSSKVETTTLKPFHRTHRRLHSYGNVDSIFLQHGRYL